MYCTKKYNSVHVKYWVNFLRDASPNSFQVARHVFFSLFRRTCLFVAFLSCFSFTAQTHLGSFYRLSWSSKQAGIRFFQKKVFFSEMSLFERLKRVLGLCHCRHCFERGRRILFENLLFPLVRIFGRFVITVKNPFFCQKPKKPKKIGAFNRIVKHYFVRLCANVSATC
jgi:hypothetical protein